MNTRKLVEYLKFVNKYYDYLAYTDDMEVLKYIARNEKGRVLRWIDLNKTAMSNYSIQKIIIDRYGKHRSMMFWLYQCTLLEKIKSDICKLNIGI